MEGQFGDFILVFLTLMCTAATGRYFRHFNTTNGHATLCTPVVCKGEILFCQDNYTSDSCVLCPRGKYLLDHLNSALINIDTDLPKCIEPGPWSCPAEAKLVFDFESANSTVCECDMSRGYYGSNFRLCNQRKTECRPGRELIDTGECVACSSHTFKPSPGYGPCIPMTDCSKLHLEVETPGTSTKDRTCGSSLGSGLQDIAMTTTSAKNWEINSKKKKVKSVILAKVIETSTNGGYLNMHRTFQNKGDNTTTELKNVIWSSNLTKDLTHSGKIEILLEDMTQKVKRYEVISIVSIIASLFLPITVLIIYMYVKTRRKKCFSKGTMEVQHQQSCLTSSDESDANV